MRSCPAPVRRPVASAPLTALVVAGLAAGSLLAGSALAGCSRPGAATGQAAVPATAPVPGAPLTQRSVPGPPLTQRSVPGAAWFPPADVLRSWDRARARAYAAGDLASLRALYVDGARAGTSDARLLRAYLSRGLRVHGMRMQLLGVEVLRREPGLLRLRVTDRLVGGVAVGPTGAYARGAPLPRDTASTRVLELRRQLPGGRWRVAWVRSGPRRAAR